MQQHRRDRGKMTQLVSPFYGEHLQVIDQHCCDDDDSDTSDDNKTSHSASTSHNSDTVLSTMELYIDAVELVANTWGVVRNIPAYELVVGKILFRQ